MSQENLSKLATDHVGSETDAHEFHYERRKSRKISYVRRALFGSLLQTWADVSRINYLPAFDTVSSDLRFGSIDLPSNVCSTQDFSKFYQGYENTENLPDEQFPLNVTSLMNEDQLWGCFYNFPELYNDVYSPIVRIRNVEDVPDTVGGVLTRDMVTACLSYLKRTPILGDFVYIKLDLSSKFLKDITALQHYKYLVYLDLSGNLITDLSILSNLLYLQYLSVSCNRLNKVLDYETPQWFLTEVNYKYNSVMSIRDLTDFWSITVLDLSHNNIRTIDGLQNLKYLRRLDLSFNHIQRLENLNHLRILWLDVSYNNISSFEFGDEAGLWTLLHLEYLNLNDNNLTSMKIFSGCTRLRELHARNNCLSVLLELAVYMRQLRHLIVFDLRSNPVCSVPNYRDVVISTFPLLLNLDSVNLDPIEQRLSKMNMSPDVANFATQRLLRLLYIEQLSKARVPPSNPPADTTEVPIVVLVGYEAVGKGSLTRRLAMECTAHIEMAKQHTTATYHYSNYYKEVSRSQFDEMLLAGEFLTYSEINGESYGLSREEASVKGGKVKIVTMDLLGALMLKLRGRRPYLILASCSDKRALAKRQRKRKETRNLTTEKRLLDEYDISTLQVLLSGRIIITGILNEILNIIPEDKDNSKFVIESECSLMMDSETRKHTRKLLKGVDRLTLLTYSTTSTQDDSKNITDKSSKMDTSLYSLYKDSECTEEYISQLNGQQSYQDDTKKTTDRQPSEDKNKQNNNIIRPKSVDFSKYASFTWKGPAVIVDSMKSSKSVTFTSQNNIKEEESAPSEMCIEMQSEINKVDNQEQMDVPKPISVKIPLPHTRCDISNDSDLWLTFLIETGLVQASDIRAGNSDKQTHDTKIEDLDLSKQLECYYTILSVKSTTNIRDDYEDIHRNCPGLFWDTVTMDNKDAAFRKMKNIIRNITKSQKTMKPMFDIDFSNLENYPIIKERLTDISKDIGSQKIFI